MGAKKAFRSMRIFMTGILLMIPLVLVNVCYADEPLILDGDPEEPGTGIVYIGAYGNYQGDAQAALDYINAVRLEACLEGVPNPNNPSVPLTEADYVPLKWSTSLEKIARIRASEVAFVVGHVRHNGQNIWTISYDGVTSNAENLAWNFSSTNGMVSGLERFYDEKANWLWEASGKEFPNDGKDHQTGHYTAMINPSFRYVGVASFYSSEGLYPNAVAQEFSATSKALSQDALPLYSGIYQKVKVQETMLGNYGLEVPEILSVGDDAQIVVKADFTLGKNKFRVRSLEQFTYSSSNVSVLTVSSDGRMTPVAIGTATVTVKKGNTTIGTKTVTVNSARSLSEETKISLSEERYQYDGSAKTPTVTVIHNGVYLKQGTQYTVSYSNNIQVGTARVTVTGIGNCSGTVVKEFEVFCDHVGNFTKVEGQALMEGDCDICHNHTYIELPTSMSVLWRNEDTATDGYYYPGPGQFTNTVGSTLVVWLDDLNGDERYRDIVFECSDWSKLDGPRESNNQTFSNFKILGAGTVVFTAYYKYNPDVKMSWRIQLVSAEGEQEPTEITDAYTLYLGAALTGEIYLDVRVAVDETKYASISSPNPYITVMVGDRQRAQIYLKDAQTEYFNNQLTYAFRVMIYAKEMDDDISFHFNVNDSVADTKVLYTNFNSYLDTLASEYSSYDILTDLVESLRNYGSYSRMFFDHNDDTMTEEDFPAELTSKEDINNALESEIAEQGNSDCAVFYGMTLVLENKIEERFYFKSDVDLRTADSNVQYSEENKMYYISVTQIDFDRLDEVQTVTVDGLTVSARPLDYVKLVMMNVQQEDLVNLCRAIYDCYTAAKAYNLGY